MSHRLLVIDPDPTRGMELYAALRDLRVEAELVVDAEQGWRRFAAMRPAVVIAALGSGGKSGGDSFLRRLRDEYMGTLPSTYLLCAAEDLAAAAALDPNACLVPPISRSALAAIAGAAPGGGLALDSSTRLRELFDLSLLGGDMVRGLDALVGRAALAFQVSDCAAWAWGGDGQTWPRVSRPIGEAERAELFDRVRLAGSAARTVFLAPRAGKNAITEAAGHSILALPLVSGELVLGGVALLADGARLYDSAERDALVLLARRMTAELAWVSAHARLLVEHERLREAALLDPLTGVWNRSALEQAITAQIQAAARMPQALTLMAIDVIRLGAINDKHGHKTGDGVLAHLAGLIAANLRAHDVVGRVHGDEFAVLLVGCDANGAKAAADHVRAGVRRAPYRLGDQKIEFEIRIGISEIRRGEDAGVPALARAEAAMRRTRARTTEVSAIDGTDDSFHDEPGTADRDAIPAGVTLGGMYRVLHEISRGAMGVVYRGEDLGLGRQVALKVLRADLASDQALVARFRAEAAMLASIHHTNMVQVHAFGTDGDLVYFVMELVEGEAVADVLTRVEQSGVPIELSLIAKVTHEVASALDEIHAVGIVHRDVKPDNILIDRVHDRAVLVDVGVAKRRGSEREAAGTPGFAAPESFMDRDPSPALDVYGLAATAYAMLTDLPPFGSGDLLPVFERQTQESPARPSLLRPGLSTEVDEVLLRALAADPARRQKSARAFAFALGRALEHSGDGMAVPLMEIDDEVAHTQRYPSVRTDSRGTPQRPFECRGQFFRSAYLTLGRQRGTNWLVQVGGENAILARLVRPSTPVDGWHSADLLGLLLQRSQGQDKARLEAARQLGQAALSAGFDQLVIAGGRRIEALLGEAPEVWSRFFRGAALKVDELGASSLRVTVDPGPGNRLVCALIEGWLMRLIELVGASSVLPEHPQHATGAAGPCRFALRWE